MNELLTIGAAGFGLAGLIVIPVDGPVAFVRNRLPRVRPLHCLLCATPWATAVVYGIQAVTGGWARELLLVVLIGCGITAGAMVLRGFADPNPAKAEGCRGCKGGAGGEASTVAR